MPDLDVEAASAALERANIEALELRPPIQRVQRYHELGERAVAMPAFMLDLGGPWTAIGERLHGSLAPTCRDRRSEGLLLALIDDVRRILGWASSLAHARRTLISVRNWFAPGDLVWHVDRSRRSRALRILWTIGRSAGIRFTSRSSIDPVAYRAWMRREHPLLCRLDRLVFETGRPLEDLWAHRPRQVHAMASGDYPFVRDPNAVRCMNSTSISVHRLETPHAPGTWHRSAFENSQNPGLQFIMTVTT